MPRFSSVSGLEARLDPVFTDVPPVFIWMGPCNPRCFVLQRKLQGHLVESGKPRYYKGLEPKYGVGKTDIQSRKIKSIG